MNIFQKISLKDFSSMRLGGTAEYLTEVTTKEELTDAIKWAKFEKLGIIIIGGGNNIIWKDEGFKGLIIVNKILGFETFNYGSDDLLLTIGAGEDWDFVVKRSVDLGYSGIETLSLIPGTAGATPVQNIGAYGSDISNTLVSVEAYDTVKKQFVIINNEDCHFSYRSSRFKAADKNRFYITAITLKVSLKRAESPYYASVQQYFDKHNVTKVTPRKLREAVISIRESKLPDPKIIPNNGSFFTNPIINKSLFDKLIKEFPEITYWSMGEEKIKVSAAWLMDSAGFKAINDHDTGISTWPTQTLVLVNTSANNTQDLVDFRDKVINSVKSKFNITLQQEPELLP